MSDPFPAAVRARPLLAASGAVASVVLLLSAGLLVGVFVVPTPLVVEPALLVLSVCSVSLAGLIGVRVVHGALGYLDGEDGPSVAELVLAALETSFAAVCVVVLGVTSLFAAGPDLAPGDAVVGGMLLLVWPAGMALALVSLTRALVGVRRDRSSPGRNPAGDVRP